MSRKSVDGLGSRYSLLRSLPALYAGDDFATRLVGAFDDVVAPVQASIDDLEVYVDPRTAPSDFLEWMGGWMGLTVNRRWPIHRRREFVARALSVYMWRGTRRGIEEAVELYTGVRPEVTDSGGVSASPDPLGDLPGAPGATVEVIVRTSDPTIDRDLIDAIVTDVKPAHVRHTVTLTSG